MRTVLAMAVVSGLAVIGCTTGDASTEPAPTTVTVPVGTAIDDLEPGACLAEAPDAPTGRVETVDCGRPHRAEVYATADLDGNGFPGITELSEEAALSCSASYARYAGEPIDPTTDLAFAELIPSEASWRDGDRHVVCLALPPAGAQAEGTIAADPAPAAP